MRFLVDMALSPDLANWLRSIGHDALHVTELNLSRATDAQIMERAVLEARVVITADLDFPRLLASLQTQEPGLILLRGGNYNEYEAIECVRRVLAVVRHEELATSIVVVDNTRVRRRRLPI
jgi:predicted nuclease of predicted toxin-antitoxin system